MINKYLIFNLTAAPVPLFLDYYYYNYYYISMPRGVKNTFNKNAFKQTNIWNKTDPGKDCTESRVILSPHFSSAHSRTWLCTGLKITLDSFDNFMSVSFPGSRINVRSLKQEPQRRAFFLVSYHRWFISALSHSIFNYSFFPHYFCLFPFLKFFN